MAFISSFRHLVYDCELDYKRLSLHTSNAKGEALQNQLALEDAKKDSKEVAPSKEAPGRALALVVKPSKVGPWS